MIQQTEEREDLQLNMAPMIDMVFLLIIFFLTATTFTEREREQDVLLPQNQAPGSLSRNDNSLIINIKADGSVWVHGEQQTRDALIALVKKSQERATGELRVQLRGDKRVEYRFVMDAMQACLQGGVKKPYLNTSYDGDE